MDFLVELWLPVLLSAVFVFVVSSLVHMVLRIHNGDYKKLPGEEKILEAFRSQGLSPGHYFFPGAENMKDMCTPAMAEKFKTGPVGFMIVKPSGMPNIGKSLVQWFLLCFGIGIFVAYIAALGLKTGTDFMTVFRLTASAAFLGYGFSHIQESIWKGLSWAVSLKFVFDGLLYALTTGATFAWLWPK